MMLATEQLSELIHRKHEVLAQLRDLGQRQQEVVQQGETSTLLKLLATKQTMIVALQNVEQELAPFHAEDPEQRVWPSREARSQCARQAAECNRLLQEIVELERYCGERMTLRRNEVAAQLRHVNTAGQARDAYEANRVSSAGRGDTGPPAVPPSNDANQPTQSTWMS